MAVAPGSVVAPTKLLQAGRTAQRPRSQPGALGYVRAGSALDLTADEGLDGLLRVVVDVLLRRRLHEVAGGRHDRATDAAVLGDLRGAHGVDDGTGRVRRVPDLQLE